MPTYHHTCKNCSATTELSISISDYEELEEKHGRGDNGNVRFPCDEEGCEGWSERDYSKGCAVGIVKGGYKYSTRQYRAGAEEEWVRNEVENTKKVITGQVGRKHRPYAGMVPANLEKEGFRRVSPQEAKERADMAKKTQGDAVSKVEKGRKRKDIQ